jgi:hypothetical protein
VKGWLHLAVLDDRSGRELLSREHDQICHVIWLRTAEGDTLGRNLIHPRVRREGSMAFADKARYFDQCATKARDEDSRDRFAEAADFYWKLRQVAPDFPPKFPGGTVWRGTRWEKRAEECRTMADYFTDPECKAMMTRLADDYDRIACNQMPQAAE